MNRYHPKVSIVIPAYNASNYLAQAIESSLAQSYDNIEIIVVNDGSKDDGETERVASRYKDKIKYVWKENGGSSSALNIGITNMTGDWFSWLSHDDLYYPNKVAEQIKYLNELLENDTLEDQLHKHILFAAADLIDGDGRLIKKETDANMKKTDLKINSPDGVLQLIAIPTQDGFHGCSCLIHRSAFDEVGMFDENLRLLNDMDLWYRFYTNGFYVHFIPQVLVCGRVHAKQVSRSIGFSYHNAEQDMFWRRSLQWLKDNQAGNYRLFYLYGKTALLKTRFHEGKQAFSIAAKIDPNKKAKLFVESLWYISRASVRSVLKKIYLLVLSR